MSRGGAGGGQHAVSVVHGARVPYLDRHSAIGTSRLACLGSKPRSLSSDLVYPQKNEGTMASSSDTLRLRSQPRARNGRVVRPFPP